MAEFLTGMKRTCYCGDVTAKYDGRTITVMGWANNRRDLGGLIFVDLRDRTGILQIVFDESIIGESFKKAEKVRGEYVLAVTGCLRRRSAAAVNKKIKTGRFELAAAEIRIVSESETTPYALDDSARVNEALKLKYRYLDLRTPELQGYLLTRDKITKLVSDYLSKNAFINIETPFLGKSTPEGARDYLVPSRVHPGSFYALPQSPQLYKQLLMISGFDRYYQIARCFRDEDLRANRQPEFTQIDFEMSFVDSEEDVMQIAEGMIADIFKKIKRLDIRSPIPRLTYAEAMNKYGSDKPDTRFGLELVDISDIAGNTQFQVFSNAVRGGGSVRMINAKGFIKGAEPLLSRRDIDALGEFVKTYRAKGMAWIALREDGLQSAITKFLTESEVGSILARAGAETGDLILFCADSDDEVVYASLGALRLRLAEIGGLIDKNIYNLLWVVDFPLLEYSYEEKRYVAKHHPFTSPKNEDLHLLDTAPEKIRAKAY
ncbi:MAG: aspartate--tRNA ligase, partial [Clostridiales bacterium]|nr:aspartate--tRNA ligase [Clostridiales bacterium]